MSDKSLRLNGSGVPDPTAEKAIRGMETTVRNDLPPDLSELLKTIKYITRLAGYQIDGRIAFRDGKNGKIYK